jgi:1,4-dihydroxy-2-naphthoyl-CoA hydrolase
MRIDASHPTVSIATHPASGGRRSRADLRLWRLILDVIDDSPASCEDGRRRLEIVAMTPLQRIHANPLPFAELLRIDFVSAKPDRIVARMRVEPEHCTLGGIVHGGALMALADTMGGVGAFLNLDEKAAGTTTIESKTNFLGPARAGSVLVATAAPIHRGRRTQVWQTRIETEEGRPVALTIQTQLTM